MEHKKHKHPKHHKLNAGGHGGGGHEGGHGEGEYGGVIYAGYPYYPYPYPYCLQDEKGQCVNPYPTAESATMRGFFGMNSRNTNFRGMKSDIFKADADAINGANPVFNGTHYKKFQNVSNSIGGFPEYLSRVPGASLGDYIKAKGIPGTIFSDFLKQTGITLTPTSSVDEVSDAMNLAQKNLHHSRSKMLKGKLLLLNDFMLSGSGGTFGAYLGTKKITADQFSSGLPDSLNNPAIFNQTAQQIVPYITAANDTYFEQFKKFVKTAPDDIDSKTVFDEFDKSVPRTEINASGNYNALGLAISKAGGSKTSGSGTVSSVKTTTTGTKVNTNTNTLVNKTGATAVDKNLAIDEQAVASQTKQSGGGGTKPIRPINSVVTTGSKINTSVNTLNNKTTPAFDPNLATNQQIVTSQANTGKTNGGQIIHEVLPPGQGVNNAPNTLVNAGVVTVDPNLATNQQTATSQINSGQVPNPNTTAAQQAAAAQAAALAAQQAALGGGASGGGASGGGGDGGGDDGGDSGVAPAATTSTDVPIYYGFSIKGVSLKGLVDDVGNAAKKTGEGLSKDAKILSAEFRASLHVLNEYDPLMVAVRAMVGSCFDVNLFNMATNFNKVKSLPDQTHWKKTTDLWNTLGGKPADLGNMINRGAGKKAFLAASGFSADSTTPAPTTLGAETGATVTGGIIAVNTLSTTPLGAAALSPIAVGAGSAVGGLTTIVAQALPGTPANQTPPPPATSGLSAQNQAALDSIANGTAQGNSVDETNKKAATTMSANTKKYIIGGLVVVALIVGLASVMGSKKTAA